MKLNEFKRLLINKFENDNLLKNIYSRSDDVFYIQSKLVNIKEAYISYRIVTGYNRFDVEVYCVIQPLEYHEFLVSHNLDLNDLIVESDYRVMKFHKGGINCKRYSELRVDHLEKDCSDFLIHLKNILEVWTTYVSNFSLRSFEQEVNNSLNTNILPSVNYIQALVLAFISDNTNLFDLMKKYGRKMRSSDDQPIEEFNKIVEIICSNKGVNKTAYTIKGSWYARMLDNFKYL